MRFLLRVFAVAVIVLAAIAAVRRFLAARRTSPRSNQPVYLGELVRDPVCGTYITQEGAIHAEGHFFCSEECRRKMRPADS